MFSRKDLQELAEYKGTGTPVLSLYLNVDPSQHTTDEYKLALRQLLRGAGERAAATDIAAVERYFDLEYDWSGRGVAVFSCCRRQILARLSAADAGGRSRLCRAKALRHATRQAVGHVWPVRRGRFGQARGAALVVPRGRVDSHRRDDGRAGAARQSRGRIGGKRPARRDRGHRQQARRRGRRRAI